MKKGIYWMLPGALLLGTALWAGWQLFKLNMLAPKVLWPVLAAMAILVVLLGLGLRQKRSLGLRIFCAVLAVLSGAGFVLGAVTVGKANETIDAVLVDTDRAPSSLVEVFSLRDGPVQTVEDVKLLGWSAAFDGETMKTVMAEMEQEQKQYPSVLELVDGLYQGEVDAIVLNSAYVGILESLEEYADFLDRTLILSSRSVEQQKLLPPESEQLPEPEKEQPEEAPREEPPKPHMENAFVIYLSGSDSYSALLETSKSDVNILAAVNPDTHQVLMINTPRDYYVPNSAGDGALDKLTHCGIYGVECSMDALSGLYDEPIDYYARINFAGFKQLVDALGGVTVYSDFEFSGFDYYFTVGPNELDGERALAFARTRHAFATQDLQRGKNQMKLIEAIIAKAISGTTLITNYSAIMESLQGMFVTDVPRSVMEALVRLQLEQMPDWNIKTYAVNGAGDMQHTYSTGNYNAYVMWPYEADLAHGHSLLEAVLTGEILTDEMMTVPAPPAEPEAAEQTEE